MVYQILLPMVLRWRPSCAGASLQMSNKITWRQWIVYMLWFNFIFGLNFIFFYCVALCKQDILVDVFRRHFLPPRQLYLLYLRVRNAKPAFANNLLRWSDYYAHLDCVWEVSLSFPTNIIYGYKQYFYAHAVYLLWFNSILDLNFFLLFLGMVMYDNEFETSIFFFSSGSYCTGPTFAKETFLLGCLW